MKAAKNYVQPVRGILMGLVLSASLMSPAVYAVEPQLEKAILQGKNSFSHNTFGGNGKVCESCHIAGGKELGKLPNGKSIPSLVNAAAIFPRFRQKDDRVITLTDQVRSCVAMALQGTPPEYGSEELNSFVSYITSLAQGRAIDMGGIPQ